MAVKDAAAGVAIEEPVLVLVPLFHDSCPLSAAAETIDTPGAVMWIPLRPSCVSPTDENSQIP